MARAALVPVLATLVASALATIVAIGPPLARTAGSSVAAGDAPLTDADRRAFTWFDGVGLPSCAGKKYVRVTWIRKSPAADAPPAERTWEIDGFLLAEDAARWTILDADQIARKVERKPAEWTASIAPLDLAATAEASAARLRAIVGDPGAVEAVEDLFRGVRKLLGDEAQALALARHCAENGADALAHALLDAARALPASGDTKPGTALEDVAAAQMADPLMRRIFADIHDLDIPRSRLLERLRAWRKSFPSSPHVPRADESIRLFEPMVKEDAAHRAIPDAELAKLPPAARAKELVFRLRDQTGDVRVLRNGRTYLDLEGENGPVDRVVALGFDAVPALLDAVADARCSRTVLYRLDETLARQFVARVGDMAQLALERISGRTFREATAEAPSMFQDGSHTAVQAQWRAWWAASGLFPSRLAAILAEKDAARRAALVRDLPDRGTGRLAGAADAWWGAKSFVAAVPKLTPDTAKSLLRQIVAENPRPRTQALAAWALLDLGDAGAVAPVAALWRAMDDAARADPEQGGAVISFLAACGRAEGIAALAEGLDERPPAVRELVVLAFADRGLGAVRGFAADAPDGIREKWALTGAAAEDAEDLLAARLTDLEQDPLGRIPRQLPICDMVPAYDCGRRTADAAIRVLAKRWPTVYRLDDQPVRPDTEWESTRLNFIEFWKTARAERPPR